MKKSHNIPLTKCTSLDMLCYFARCLSAVFRIESANACDCRYVNTIMKPQEHFCYSDHILLLSRWPLLNNLHTCHYPVEISLVLYLTRFDLVIAYGNKHILYTQTVSAVSRIIIHCRVISFLSPIQQIIVGPKHL